MNDSRKTNRLLPSRQCPININKIHCGFIEGTEAYGLARVKWDGFCLEKCAVRRWKLQNADNEKEAGNGKPDRSNDDEDSTINGLQMLL